MNAHDQVLFLLSVAVYIAPVGVYFLTLGLLSSQPTPVMLTGRADFTQLGIVFFPVVVAVVMRLLAIGGYGLALLGAVGVVSLWLLLLPRPGQSYVFYNLGAARFERLLEQAARRLGRELVGENGRWRVGSELVLRASTLSLLRTVSLSCEAASPAGQELARRLARELALQCRRQHTWPGLVGAGLVVTGCGVLAVPMLMVAGHMPALAEVVRRFVG